MRWVETVDALGRRMVPIEDDPVIVETPKEEAPEEVKPVEEAPVVEEIPVVEEAPVKKTRTKKSKA